MLNRNILILFFAQGFGSSGSAMVFMLAALVASEMEAGNSFYATLPVALMIFATMFFSLPSASIMRRFGRKFGFIFASLIGVIGAVIAILAIKEKSFWGFSLATFLIGINSIFVMQYRYAVTDNVDTKKAAKLVSLILFANIFSAFLGIYLAVAAKNLLSYGNFSGSFFLLAIMLTANVFILLFLKTGEIKVATPPTQSYRSLLTESKFLIPVTLSASAYAIMIALMTAMPISMHNHFQYSVESAAFVMQAHYLAMYLPSLISGKLVERFGVSHVLMAGILFFLCCHVIGFLDTAFTGFLLSLICLGFGWNLLYLSGTLLLSQHFQGEKRYRAQSLGELVIFSVNVIFVFSSGYLIELYGWRMLNFISGMLVIILFGLVVMPTTRSLREVA